MLQDFQVQILEFPNHLFVHISSVFLFFFMTHEFRSYLLMFWLTIQTVAHPTHHLLSSYYVSQFRLSTLAKYSRLSGQVEGYQRWNENIFVESFRMNDVESTSLFSPSFPFIFNHHVVVHCKYIFDDVWLDPMGRNGLIIISFRRWEDELNLH